MGGNHPGAEQPPGADRGGAYPEEPAAAGSAGAGGLQRRATRHRPAPRVASGDTSEPLELLPEPARRQAHQLPGYRGLAGSRGIPERCNRAYFPVPGHRLWCCCARRFLAGNAGRNRCRGTDHRRLAFPRARHQESGEKTDLRTAIADVDHDRHPFVSETAEGHGQGASGGLRAVDGNRASQSGTRAPGAEQRMARLDAADTVRGDHRRRHVSRPGTQRHAARHGHGAGGRDRPDGRLARQGAEAVPEVHDRRERLLVDAPDHRRGTTRGRGTTSGRNSIDWHWPSPRKPRVPLRRPASARRRGSGDSRRLTGDAGGSLGKRQDHDGRSGDRVAAPRYRARNRGWRAACGRGPAPVATRYRLCAAGNSPAAREHRPQREPG